MTIGASDDRIASRNHSKPIDQNVAAVKIEGP
jgi:hypothetical protein